MNNERDVLLLLIEHTAKEWEENHRLEDIYMSEERVNILLSVRALVADPENDITKDLIHERCPVFTELHRAVMLREL